ncbi:septum site-determining protein MinC [Dechloromonas sp. ZY10]|uniref:septum site-determining protein MinC n=1 Tax=Dechloromonas aquae TaxID=2664436 RepID=UPI00352767C3
MPKEAPIQFKGTTLKIILIQLSTVDVAALRQALQELTGNSPDFFGDELAVLDFSAAGELPASADWPALRQLLSESGLHAIAVHGLPAALLSGAIAAGLPQAAAEAFARRAPGRSSSEAAEPPPPPTTPEPMPTATPEPTAAPSVAPAPATMIVDKPLRSGQRVYARGGDLIVTAMVSAGAEVIADGSIHVYAPLRGRALAGASGDAQARIFTTSLEAELVSIAGMYRTFEAGVPADLARQPAVVSLHQDGDAMKLTVAALALR